MEDRHKLMLKFYLVCYLEFTAPNILFSQTLFSFFHSAKVGQVSIPELLHSLNRDRGTPT
jgi:hypothetical protein